MPSSSTSSTRRLSAIMFTDIVGYSALTQKDEALALRLLAEHNTLVRTILPRFRGNEIKTIGDAFLVEFSSALDAVQCAIALQQEIRKRNDSAKPSELFEIRIGVHLGDVVHEDGDVFGDGVNIASRIYPVATPGGVCISSSVVQQVQNKIEYPVQKLPPQALKNISLPVDLYEISLPWISGMRVRPILSHAWVRKSRSVLIAVAAIVLSYWIYTTYVAGGGFPMNRVGVLPFKNISQTPEHDYYAEGMTEELISTLSRISGLEIIARTSTLQYKDASLDFGTIGERLRAGSLVEGSVRQYGDSIRVTVRLIDASTERLLWNEDYNRPTANALKIQDDIALNVAGALRVQLLETEKSDITDNRDHDPDAWKLYLLGRYNLNKRTPETITNSIRYFEGSRDADSSFAPAYVGLAEAYTLIAGAGYGSVPRKKAVSEAIDAADKALRLDPRLADAYAIRAYIMYRLLWSWNDADSLFRRAIELKPSFAKGHEWYGLYLSLRGDTKQGLAEMRKAASLDPQSASVATGVGRLLAFDGQYEASIEQFLVVIRDHPDYAEAFFGIALSYAYIEQYDKSFRYFEQALNLSGRRMVIVAGYAFFLAKAGHLEKARALLTELENMPGNMPGAKWFRGIIHAELGDINKGFDLMEAAADDREGLLVYLRTDPFTKDFRNNQRFKQLEKRVWGDSRVQ